jgi:hypothetical protein
MYGGVSMTFTTNHPILFVLAGILIAAMGTLVILLTVERRDTYLIDNP